MLKKCGGLPLAIAALAGILKSKRSIGEWQLVSEAVRLRVMECTHTHMGKTLSYEDLSYYLKPCLLYLCIFPEDCRIPVGMLTRMWIAEGLVTANEDMSPEDVAMLRLEELSQRFMIQVVRTNFRGAIKVIQFHDLLRDLCLRRAKEEKFLQIRNASSDQTDNSLVTLEAPSRRAALHSSMHFPTPDSKLRSLILLTRSSILPADYVSNKMLDLKVVHQNYKLLRSLNLWGVATSNGTLPKQVGNLIHLRYLGIRASNITKLPRSIGKLRNLITLDYRNIDCDDHVLVKIPNVLWKLVRLRHLYLPIECFWNPKELYLGGLKNLRILSGIRSDGGSDWFSKQILELSTTLKKLKIVLSSEKDLEATFNCPSLMSNCLHSFHCEWKHGVPLQRVNPTFSQNQHLHKLVLIGNIQVKKLSIILPSSLHILELKESVLVDEDPMVAAGALAHLKVFRLSNAYLGNALLCETRSFPLLEELHLECFPHLNMWEIQQGAMPLLKKLEIRKCGNLREFPQGLPIMNSIQQLEYFGVPEEFVQEAERCGWSKVTLRLPHNIEAIIDACGSPVDISSIRMLYQQLTVGILLSNKTQKYWVMKHNDHYYNCFKIYFSGLYFAQYRWHLIHMEDSSDGAFIEVGKLYPYPFGIDLFGVHGEFNVEHLSPGVNYQIAFEIMLPRATSSRHMQAAKSNLFLPSNDLLSQEHELNDKPREEWIRIFAGGFEALSVENVVSFSLEELEPEMVVGGVVIEPRPENVE